MFCRCGYVQIMYTLQEHCKDTLNRYSSARITESVLDQVQCFGAGSGFPEICIYIIFTGYDILTNKFLALTRIQKNSRSLQIWILRLTQLASFWHLCTKYFVLQEAKPYKNDPEILAMTNLVTAYQNNDINDFEKILKQNRQTIMEDTFIREHIEDLLKNIRTQVKYSFLKFKNSPNYNLITIHLLCKVCLNIYFLVHLKRDCCTSYSLT